MLDVLESEGTAASAGSRRSASGSLRGRAAGSAAIRRCLDVQSGAPHRSAFARLVGIDPLQPTARSWYHDALAESRVAALLDTLGEGWTVLHSVPIGHGGTDIEHLVIGPGGVVAISTRYLDGRKVWVGGSAVIVGGHHELDILSAIERREDAASRLGVALGRAVPVSAVVVMVGAHGLLNVAARTDAPVLYLDQLPRWLAHLPTVQTSAEVEQTVDAASRDDTWRARPSSVVAGPVEAEAFDELRREVHVARRRRTLWELSGIAGIAAVCLSAVATGFPVTLVQAISSALAR